MDTFIAYILDCKYSILLVDRTNWCSTHVFDILVYDNVASVLHLDLSYVTILGLLFIHHTSYKCSGCWYENVRSEMTRV